MEAHAKVYNPCEGKRNGDRCNVCQRGVKGCIETDAEKTCQMGKCKAGTMPEVCADGCSDWFDGCNTCKCHKGQLTRQCTKRMCFRFDDPKCARYPSSEGSEIEEPDDQETDPVDDKIKLEDEAREASAIT